MKTRYTSVGLALTLAGYAVAASAVEPSAKLTQLHGRVFVGQAATTGPARNAMPLYAGNRVMAAAGGTAQVVYPDGCTVALPENSILAITGADQCHTGQALVRTTAGFQDKAVGQVVQQALSPAAQGFLNNFATYNASQLATGYAGLTSAEQAALVASMSTNQLADLYMATAVYSGSAAANGFLATLPAVTQEAVAAAAAAAAGTGAGAGAFIVSGFALGAAGVTAVASALAAIGASGSGGSGTIIPTPGPASK